MMPIGTLIRKIQCQVKKVVMKPPTGGPTSGPTSAGHGQPGHRRHQLALRRRAHQHQPRDRRHHRAAHALARSARSTKSTSEPDIAQAIEPTMNTPIAARNTRLAP